MIKMSFIVFIKELAKNINDQKTHINNYLSTQYNLKVHIKINKNQIKTTGCVIIFKFLNIEKRIFILFK